MREDKHRVEAQRDQWERLAQDDPLWAIISHPSLRGNQWDAETFFATGAGDLANLLTQVQDAGLTLRTGRCLDFGCGVGRMSQALATVFDHVDGVDIAPTMIQQAESYNRHGDRCAYHVNVAADLSLFEADTFDFIFSTMVLQHIASEDVERYIAEFARLLSPGGIAVFDMPSHVRVKPVPEGGHTARLEFAGGGRLRLWAGEARSLQVVVHNSSPELWPASMSIRLGNHWLSPDGAQVVQDDGRTALLTPLPSGAATTLPLDIRAPGVPGRYQLELDMVEEGVAWFERLGSPTLRLPVRVKTRRLQRGTPTAAPAAPPFSMNALPRPRVAEILRSGGARIAACQESTSAGPEWETFRYVVSADTGQ